MKKGDVVYLKSGGPAMTVGSVDGLFAECVYFHDGEAVPFGCDIEMLTSDEPQNKIKITWDESVNPYLPVGIFYKILKDKDKEKSVSEQLNDLIVGMLNDANLRK